MAPKSGIRLECEDVVLAETFEEINEIISAEGIRAWPADLSDAPSAIREFLGRRSLTESES